MYEIGSRVMYASNGVCDVTDIREENFSGEKRMYYVLVPVGTTSCVYVPTDSESLLSRMRNLCSREEVHAMIEKLPAQTDEWITDNHTRNNYFQKILIDSNMEDLLRLTRTIYLHKQDLATRGKKALMADENILKKAERILFGEIASILDIGTSEVLPFIENQLAKAE